eukprot:scaffold57498_cov69-Phaeocystis_antarctica.AAC.2
MSEVIFVTAGMLPTLCVPAALIRICGVAPTGIRVLQNRRAVRRVFSIAQPARSSSELGENAVTPFRVQRFAFYHPSSSKVTRRLAASKGMHRSTKVQCLGAAGFFIALYALNVCRRRADRAEQRGRARAAPRESEAPPLHTAHTHTHTRMQQPVHTQPSRRTRSADSRLLILCRSRATWRTTTIMRRCAT